MKWGNWTEIISKNFLTLLVSFPFTHMVYLFLFKPLIFLWLDFLNCIHLLVKGWNILTMPSSFTLKGPLCNHCQYISWWVCVFGLSRSLFSFLPSGQEHELCTYQRVLVRVWLCREQTKGSDPIHSSQWTWSSRSCSYSLTYNSRGPRVGLECGH